MMKRFMLAALAACICLSAPLFADGTPVQGLSHYRLDNGLEVFVLENHVVPLTRIQITFRCGAITQSTTTAGLFHLYEHMLFKGNSKYKTETEFSNALTDLGVAEWNGGTSTEYVTYYITVPSDKAEQGLEFWSYAVRAPLLDSAELEIEKGVVCNEINGYLSDPDEVYSSAVEKTLFPKYPWRRDIGGSDAIVRAATVQMLRDMQNAYYIPNNAAIFIGGDIKPEAALAMVKKFYGDWKKGADPWTPEQPAQAMPGVKAPVYLVYPDESLPEGIAYMEAKYRGPDVIRTPEPTYAADVWGSLIAAPSGKFKQAVFEQVPALYNKQNIYGSYYTQRDGGQLSFAVYCFTDPKLPLAERAKKNFMNAISAETKAMVHDAAYFSDNDFSIVKNRLGDEQVLSLETPEKFIETLSFWWSTASSDYFFNYIPNMKKATRADIAAFLTTYVLSNVPVVAVRINPADYEAEAKAFKAAGFITVTPENAFWWGNSK